jgi:hypothetical protein
VVAGGIVGTGVLAVTEAHDAPVVAGGITGTGVLAVTEAHDAPVVAGGIIGTGALAVTEAHDTAIIASALVGAITQTEAPDLAALAGTAMTIGTMAAIDGVEAPVVAGGITGNATLAALAAADQAALAGTARTIGTMGAIDGVDPPVVAGGIIGTGTLAATEIGDVPAIQGIVEWSVALNPVEAHDYAAIGAIALQKVGAGHREPWALLIPVTHASLDPYFAAGIESAHRQPYGSRIDTASSRAYALLSFQEAACRAPYASTNPVTTAGARGYTLLHNNPALSACRQGYTLWTLGGPGASLKSGAVSVTGPTGTIEVLSLTLTQQEDATHWIATAEGGDWHTAISLPLGTPVTVDLNGEIYSLLVAGAHMKRIGAKAPQPTLTLLSPVAFKDQPFATEVFFPTPDPISARALAGQALGLTIDWQVVDWALPPGHLPLSPISPLALVKRLAHAAGAGITSGRDGGVSLRPRFPLDPASFPQAPVDHVFTALDEILDCVLSPRPAARYNAVTVRTHGVDYGTMALSDPSHRPLAPGRGPSPQLRIDPRPLGPNRGRRRFQGGEAVALLLHLPAGMSLDHMATSAGILTRGPTISFPERVDLAFHDSDVARLPYPALALTNIQWLGASLGTLTLLPDGRHVRTAITHSTAWLGEVRGGIERPWGLSGVRGGGGMAIGRG